MDERLQLKSVPLLVLDLHVAFFAANHYSKLSIAGLPYTSVVDIIHFPSSLLRNLINLTACISYRVRGESYVVKSIRRLFGIMRRNVACLGQA